MTLKNAIGKKYLTSLQRRTFLSETEAILNSRPLVYIGDDLNEGIIITPSYFLSPNTKTGTRTVEDDDEIDDPDYESNKSLSKKILLDNW